MMTIQHVKRWFISYIGESKADHHSNPLQYWKKNKLQYPLLAQLARKYLAPPCTTVPSERLFSTAGNIVTDKRTRLDIDKVEMLLFLNKNVRLNEDNYR